MPPPVHHAVIVVGGGPGGLGVAALLNGWRPRFRNGLPGHLQGNILRRIVESHPDDLLAVDMQAVVDAGVSPFDVFRVLHHPTDEHRGREGRVIAFDRRPPVDWLMLTNEPPGGLWNNVPRNQLTLSPAHWMELAPYPIDDFYRDTGRALDPNALIEKQDLVPYYHRFAEAMCLSPRMRVGRQVTGVSPGEAPARFHITSEDVETGEQTEYASEFLVFAVGPRAVLRRLDVPGEDLDYVSNHYDHWDDYPGERVLVVGGGRSADWAATELHDAGRHVTYVMRGPESNHLRLIDDSQHLPYYRRIREIIRSGTGRFERLYGTRVAAFQPGGYVALDSGVGLTVDHAVIEIGGEPSYDLLSEFGPLTLVEGRDRYRLQLMQMAVTPATFESVDIPGLYPGGYLAQGTGISVLGMHGTAYPAAASILRAIGAP